MALVGPGKGGVGNVNRIKEAFGPSLWFQWLQHNRLAVVADANGRRGKVKPFRQADGLTLAFVNNGSSFHNGRQSMLP